VVENRSLDALVAQGQTSIAQYCLTGTPAPGAIEGSGAGTTHRLNVTDPDLKDRLRCSPAHVPVEGSRIHSCCRHRLATSRLGCESRGSVGTGLEPAPLSAACTGLLRFFTEDCGGGRSARVRAATRRNGGAHSPLRRASSSSVGDRGDVNRGECYRGQTTSTGC